MKKRGEAGFTLLEVLVGVVIMTLMVIAVTNIYLSNLRSLTFAKARALGLGLASQQMEYLRDLPYDSLATQLGAIYPAGNIPDNKTVTSNNYSFRMHTEITYVDDPYDGVESGPLNGKPQDLYPYDYKRVRVQLFLINKGVSNQLVSDLSTDVAGKAAETSSSTGIISVKVVDANGQPITNANVTITNSNPSPAVNISTNTDNNGFVIIPKLPPDSANGYQVVATLAGYSTDGTIADPPGAQTAVKQNLNVLAQQISAVTLAIDHTATLSLHVVDTAGANKGAFTITTSGSKAIKSNPTVYKYNQPTSTDATGNITLNGMEWDSYSFAVPAGYYVVASSPYAPYPLSPNAVSTVTLTVSNSASYPAISAALPASAVTGSASVTLKLTGRNLSPGTTMILRKGGQSDIAASSVTSASGSTTLTGTLNLSGAAAGAWDIIVSNANGTTTQTGGFNVTP